MKDNLKKNLSKIFGEGVRRSDAQFIEDVLAGRVRKEPPPPTKPAVPSIKGKKIILSWKDPEAIHYAVEYFADELLKGVKNGNLVREEVHEAIHRAIDGFGEQIDVEVDLDTGEAKILP